MGQPLAIAERAGRPSVVVHQDMFRYRGRTIFNEIRAREGGKAVNHRAARWRSCRREAPEATRREKALALNRINPSIKIQRAPPREIDRCRNHEEKDVAAC